MGDELYLINRTTNYKWIIKTSRHSHPTKKEANRAPPAGAPPRLRAAKSPLRKANRPSELNRSSAIHGSSFRDFQLRQELLRAIGEAGFEHPSEVQQEGIPHILYGDDLLCQAKSGMGKTAVFVLGVLHSIKVPGDPFQCLVLCHTRELAFQISKEFERMGKYINGLKLSVIYGGVKPEAQMLQIESNPPHVIIGTPGRTLDFLKKGIIKVDNLTHFIIDECDKVLETMDMRGDVQEIFLRTKPKKQVMMFTATLNEKMKEVALKFMKDVHHIIYIDDQKRLTLHGLRQFYAELTEKQKNKMLFSLLHKVSYNQCIIFTSKVDRAKFLNKLLLDMEFPSITIHSEMSQKVRCDN